jgi:ABC-type polysaccharide/polyol phosphate transport system ATPase subunit
MSEPVIEALGVEKSFDIPVVHADTLRQRVFGLFRPQTFETLRVLKSISFAVDRGETVGIMGRNGSGKSTLLKVLSGIYLPEQGQIAVRAPLTPILELGVGWNAELNAIDNIYLIGTLMGLSLREIRRSLGEILAFAELQRFAHLELRHYSSGMAARLAYSVAFRAVRDILVLDEIFAVGDAGFKERCQARYRELSARGHTVLLVSHDPQTIVNFCDRALLIEGGQILVEGEPRDVCQRYLQLLTTISQTPFQSDGVYALADVAR